jgi:predicted ABC-type sugar transport system permease subunit
MREKTMLKTVRTQTKIAVGSALSTLGALAIVLSLLLGWTEAPSPWDFLLGFVVGVVTGLGATLAVAGLVERRRGS